MAASLPTMVCGHTDASPVICRDCDFTVCSNCADEGLSQDNDVREGRPPPPPPLDTGFEPMQRCKDCARPACDNCLNGGGWTLCTDCFLYSCTDCWSGKVCTYCEEERCAGCAKASPWLTCGHCKRSIHAKPHPCFIGFQCSGCLLYFCEGDSLEVACQVDYCCECFKQEGDEGAVAACWRCRHDELVDCDVCSRALCSEHRGDAFETRARSLRLAPGIVADESRCGECLGAWAAGPRDEPME